MAAPAPRRPRVPVPLLVLALPVAVVLIAVLGLRVAYADRALPGTELAGASVSGKTEDEIRTELEQFATRTIVVRAGDRRLRVDPVEAGYAANIEATLDRVMDAGRDGALGGLLSTVGGITGRHEVLIDTRIDTTRLDRTVTRIAQSVDREAFPGALDVDAELLEVGARPPRSGREIDRDDLRQRLLRALQTGRRDVRASVQTTRVASRADVERVAQEAQDYLDAPVRVTGIGEPLTLEASKVAPILRLSTAGDDGTVSLGTSAAETEKLVASIAARRDRKARDAELSAPGRSTIVDGKGDVTWRPKRADVRVVRDGRSGRVVQRERSAERVTAAVRAGEHDIALATTETKPAVGADAARGLDRLIGTFTTRYEPGQPRVTNIRRIARTVDGTLVAPGATFSLNGRVGQRTEADGYVEAPFIADGKIVPSVGGGVSQFSTTLYNAAYFAGLRLDAHMPHSLYIARYPPGREATLNFPDIDLRWTNDTDAPVLIRTFTDETSVTVSLYGDNGGRRVSADTGARRPVAGGDFAITVTRVVRYADGREVRQPYTTTYDQPAEGE
ncbi:VanW family protein [Paraconexibacter algicola]|uniref:YoaR-like putative peptidoglycan binding domain-containing protein n=1 Tax=Paraconexibacter algicola TaxID=2133960 RepID=A0A2T4UGL8_9ACTN|nr:VanW family protein [Paraconexibacter algicola]PTL58345.1 hypothetical protein C7Y72_01115 [Paraconexibacter algicola]